MSKLLQTLTIAGFTCFSLLSAPVFAQQSKDKMGEFDEIIIKRKSNTDAKVTVEIKNGEVWVDGKKVDQYNNPDLSIFRRNITPMDGNTIGMTGDISPFLGLFGGDEAEQDDNDNAINIKPNKALLGVLTEKSEARGVTVKTVSPNSPAEKAGIKTGDIILQVDNKKIEEPKDLYETIGTYNPGDKITLTYIRNKKESKTSITLGERKTEEPSIMIEPHSNRQFFNFQQPGWGPRGNNARLGLQVEDTENGQGAKVTDIAEGSAAEKAGFKADDIVTEFGGTAVKSARDVANAYRSNLTKQSVTAKVIRNGATQTLDIKIPKKINKVNL
ncbi:MAG: PDZ domain-containing protein [Chitinophaga sp.]|uniref:PDZ domain-containing protein n=1 Tax=Chitinophaga sp. TaxID=1869181 RepID=UPI0025C53094|nr:PDZ domain-containing protein [Chitinophaga sp.]MBV8254960.1 PDZ domain-containing protein [Chitinophaga sp.]